MHNDVAIWYSGARYQLGRWQHGYGIWPLGMTASDPVAQWPQTPEGWAAAWSWFAAAESPESIVRHIEQPPRGDGPAAAASAAGLAAGVALGIAGLFPNYLSGASLAQQGYELAPHVVYLAAWTASALLIVSGGARRRAGALLGLGVSVVTFGFFFADAGTVISGGSPLRGGLLVSLSGWLACTIGAALALSLPAVDGPRKLERRPARGPAVVAAAAAAAIGAAITFAPSWDSYTLRTASGAAQYLTAGNSFANPGPVIAGDLAVMVAIVVIAVAAALWRPLRLGAALLAGALIPMAAEVASALLQLSEPLSSAQFGIPPAQASQIGLTMSAGMTPWFWAYCVFVAALAAVGVWMLVPARPARPAVAAVPEGTPWLAPMHGPASPAGPAPEAPAGTVSEATPAGAVSEATPAGAVSEATPAGIENPAWSAVAPVPPPRVSGQPLA